MRWFVEDTLEPASPLAVHGAISNTTGNLFRCLKWAPGALPCTRTWGLQTAVRSLCHEREVNTTQEAEQKTRHKRGPKLKKKRAHICRVIVLSEYRGTHLSTRAVRAQLGYTNLAFSQNGLRYSRVPDADVLPCRIFGSFRPSSDMCP